MADITNDSILKTVKEKNIGIIQMWFTDVLGILKGFAITPSELEEALYEGMGFDGSSIHGFARIEESDLIAKPDIATFQILPWKNNGTLEARVICDILEPGGAPYEGDPRYVLKKLIKKLEAEGLTYYVGPELEYFYFKDDKSIQALDVAGYFDSVTIDHGHTYRRETVSALQSLGIRVEYEHHEVGHSQHEIDLRYDQALKMADTAMTYRMVVKEVARRNGCYATFMPKPIFGQNGSGMHVHQSLFRGDKNEFFDASNEYLLSEMARHYIAGLMRYAPEITAICNQWVNSYKRLVPGYEAPVYISWARRNRSAMIRVPMYKPGKEKATRIEYRSPDPACNPYLAFAVMLGAGLEGIKNKMELAAPIEEDIYEMNASEREALGIKELPDSLYSAILEVEKSKLVKDVLGDHIFKKFIENKKIEWDRFRIHVSQYEIDEYLPVL